MTRLWPKPLGPRHTTIGVILLFLFLLYPGLLVSLISSLEADFFPFSCGHGERKGGAKEDEGVPRTSEVDLVYLVWDMSIHMQGFPPGAARVGKGEQSVSGVG